MQCAKVSALTFFVMLSSNLSLGETPAERLELSKHQTTAGHAFHYFRIPDAETVAITVSWPSDWIYDGKAVAVPLVGSRLMLEGGAAGRDPVTLLADFQDLNALGDIDPNLDDVRGTLVVPPQSLSEAAAIGQDVLTEPQFDDQWRKRILQDFEAELAEEQNRTATQTWDTASRYILGDGPLNDFLTMQRVSLLDGATLADLKTWHAETFKTENIKIVAAGPVEPTVIADAIDQLLDGLPAGPKDDGSATMDKTKRFPGKTILLHKPDAEKTMIAMMGSLPPTRDPGYLADLMAVRVLGRINRSRLYDAIRTKLRASYDLGAGTYNYNRGTRLIYLYGEVDDRRLEDAYAAFRDAYEVLRTDGLRAEELETAKEVLTASFEDMQGDPEDITDLLVDFLLDENDLVNHFDELPDVVEAIELNQINMALPGRLPAFDEMVRIVTTPKRDGIDADCIISSVAEVDRCRK